MDSGSHVPEIEGPLYLKSEGKKAWKRFYFVLRASGIYYNPKGKSKVNLETFVIRSATFLCICHASYKKTLVN